MIRRPTNPISSSLTSRGALLALMAFTLGWGRGGWLAADPVKSPEAVEARITLSHGPRRPTTIPIVPGLNAGRSLFSGGPGKPADEPRYEPVDGDCLAIHNGPRSFNHILTAGVWHLLVGDRPALKMTFRGERGSYALPNLLPGLGIEGELRLAVTAAGKTKWLHRFDRIDAVLSPGAARWRCSDSALPCTLTLEVHPFVDAFGFAATARVENTSEPVALTWVFGSSQGNRRVEIIEDYARVEVLPGAGGGFIKDPLKYTQVYVGLTEAAERLGAGTADLTRDTAPAFDPEAKQPFALLAARPLAAAPLPASSRLVCVWGYSDYDRAAVDEAYRRLEYKPFPDPAWVERMKTNWFHHWVGRGLEPARRFLETRSNAQPAIDRSLEFWGEQRRRLRIQTPDPRFDHAVNHVAATLRYQFEYPAFAHGVNWLKYGKISCGYSGYEACGYHAEVADSLHFIAGTQDVKGRQRYFEPVFSIASWCEEQNFYFVLEVWHHYRWTGDRTFLKAMWPAVLRAIDHALVESDPDGDGLMTGYYEQWNCDGHGRGGRSAIWTGIAVAALRAVEDMAAILGGRFMDTLNAPVRQFPREPEYAAHYRALRQRSETRLKQDLWEPEIGAYCSAEWNGDRRPRPEAMEQSWFIWRGVGDSLDNYQAMRYVRDNLHLRPAPDVTMELMNDWWPATWSHHYVANGDTAYTIASGCAAGDVEHYWPALKSITETLYRSDTATLTHGMANDGTGRGMTGMVELEPMVALAVVEGLFGVQPRFGENLLVLRPNLPSDWPEASITTSDFTYAFSRRDNRLELRVTTPQPRKVRAELPVRSRVLEARCNGQAVSPGFETAVNQARVVLEAPAGTEHRFELDCAPPVRVEGSLDLIDGRESHFVVSGAEVRRVLDPQRRFGDSTVRSTAAGTVEVALRPRRTGRCTVFLELNAGQSSWWHPLDLAVHRPWSLVERSLALHQPNGPAVAMPRLDLATRTLELELRNHGSSSLTGVASITALGRNWDHPVTIAALETTRVSVPLTEVWERWSPGTLPVQVTYAGQTEHSSAVSWPEKADVASAWAPRLRPVNLGATYNISLTRLYGKEFFWRHDYTGCGVGIDWRDPMPLKDALGYVLMTRPIDQFEYHTLPEAVCGTASFEPPPFSNWIGAPFGLGFAVGAHPLPATATGNMLALASTEPYEQLPSQARIELPDAPRLERVYLLTANLTKTVKCYYPGAEAVIHYATGEPQLEPLVPPHTMPCFGQRFCPRAYAIPFGKIHGDVTPLNMGGNHPHLAVTDVVLDPQRPVTALEFRCVASETVLGLVGLTLLEPASP